MRSDAGRATWWRATGAAARVLACAAAVATGSARSTARADAATGTACVDATSPELRGELSVGVRDGSPADSRDVPAGASRTLAVRVKRGPAVDWPRACAEWSVEPKGAATVDPHTGALAVRADATPGTALTVRAVIPRLARPLVGELRVVPPPAVAAAAAKAPSLAGVWHQRGAPSCPGARPRPPATEPVRELELTDGGRFSVTFHPFETYRDYWGDYVVDPAAGTIRLKVESGNSVPKRFGGHGRYALGADGRLRLHGVWLGTRDDDASAPPPACTYEFER